MRPHSPVLLERIVETLRKRPGPRSSADLAREFLGVGILDESVADRLLGPILGADPRLQSTPAGWELAAVIVDKGRLGNDLGQPFVAVFAPLFPGIATFHGSGEAAFSVAAGGEAEVQRAELRLGRTFPRPVISLGRVARRLRGFRGTADPPRLAATLGLAHLDSEEPEGQARLVGDLWEHFRAEFGLEEIESLADLDRLLEESLEAADFRGKEFGPADLAGLAEGPGVYLFSRGDGRSLYVGQSGCLRARVCSYFRGQPRDEKDRAIRTQAARIRCTQADTGADALLLEARWIRRYRPLLNTRLRVQPAEEGDGLLAVPGRPGGPPLVVYVIRGGSLIERIALPPGPARARRAAEKAAKALLGPVKEKAAGREGASLLTTWRRLHPQVLYLTPEAGATERRVVDLLLS